jgi:hypothetical protein
VIPKGEAIDYLFAEDFEERFGFDPWDTPELHPKTHEVEIDQAHDEGRLISITDEGMVMAGWRLVNISHRGICPIPVADPKSLTFLDGLCVYEGCINEPHDEWNGNEDHQVCDEHLEDARKSAKAEAQYDRGGDR